MFITVELRFEAENEHLRSDYYTGARQPSLLSPSESHLPSSKTFPHPAKHRHCHRKSHDIWQTATKISLCIKGKHATRKLTSVSSKKNKFAGRFWKEVMVCSGLCVATSKRRDNRK